MPVGDAVQQRPTLEQELAVFKGFTSQDGEVVAGGGETTEEKEANAAADAADATAKAAVAAKGEPGKAVTETDEQKAAREAAAADPDAAAKAATEKAAADDETTTITVAEHKKQMARAASKRIGEVKQQGREALVAEQARYSALEQRLAAIERGDKTTPLTQPSAAAKDGVPDPKTFQYGELDAGYIRALARYETRQELEASAKTTKETQQRDAAAREAQEVAKQTETFKTQGSAKYGDFEEVVFDNAYDKDTNPSGWVLSATLGPMLLTSEQGAAVAYHLATHAEEAKEVFGKSPLEQAAWLGRQEAKLSSATPGASAAKTPAAKVSKAPIPPANQARGAGGNSSANEATTDFSAFERMARAH